MRRLAVAALAGLLLIAPLTMTSASESRSGIIFASASGAVPVSTPVAQNATSHLVSLAPGRTVTAVLSWTDSSGGTLGGNDLDLALGVPSAPPVPINPPADPALIPAWAQAHVQGTLIRATCSNFATDSTAHVGGSSESISYTVPAGGETGNYRVIVTGFLVTVDQAFDVTITVTDSGGNDITTAALGAEIQESFIRTSAHCQFI